MAGKHGSARDRADAKALAAAGGPDIDVRRLERWRGELRLGPLEDALQDERTAHYLVLADLLGSGRGKEAKRIALIMAGRYGLATLAYRDLLVEQWPGLQTPGFPRLGPKGAADDAERFEQIEKIAASTFDLVFTTDEPRDEVERLGIAVLESLLPNLGASAPPKELPEEAFASILEDVVSSSAVGIERLDPLAMGLLAGVEGEVPTNMIEAVAAPVATPVYPLAGTIASTGDLRTLARAAKGLASALGEILGEVSGATGTEECEIACAKLAPGVLAYLGSSPARAALCTMLTSQPRPPSLLTTTINEPT